MKDNIKYGWVEPDQTKHIEEIKNFRELYRTNSLEKILKSGIGTCIESALIAKFWFDNKNIESKLFCQRKYEEDISQKIMMHIIILFKEKDNWIHFEHSNREKQGLHEYLSVEDALNTLSKGHEDNILTEIPDIPSGLSFKEFVNYVNSFDIKQNSKTK